jgi:hypothetical protein
MEVKGETTDKLVATVDAGTGSKCNPIVGCKETQHKVNSQSCSLQSHTTRPYLPTYLNTLLKKIKGTLK